MENFNSPLIEQLPNLLGRIACSDLIAPSPLRADDFKEKMEAGIFLSELNRKTKPCQVEIIGPYTFRIILTQGLNRQIRRMCGELGLKVNSLQRVRAIRAL